MARKTQISHELKEREAAVQTMTTPSGTKRPKTVAISLVQLPSDGLDQMMMWLGRIFTRLVCMCIQLSV